MSDALVISVDAPVPDYLRTSALGVAFVGPPDGLFLVFREELTAQEIAVIRSDDYVVGAKLYQSDRVAGLVWYLLGDGLRMNGFANYSLRAVRETLGDDVAQEYVEGARRMSFAGSPESGLLLRLVFVDPETDRVFGLRAFALPRLFSDRFLGAIIQTVDQDPDLAERRALELFAAGPDVWSKAKPGVAVSGEEIELDEGDWSRVVRKVRSRR